MELDEIQQSIQTKINQSLNQPNSDKCQYGIGNVTNPEIFLIGDVVAGSQNLNQVIKCWAGFKKNKSSYFLHSALNFSEHPDQFYLTNIQKTNKIEEDQKLLNLELTTLLPQKIILMGKNAELKFLNWFSIYSIVSIPHPSYIRRFNLMTPFEYFQLMKIS